MSKKKNNYQRKAHKQLLMSVMKGEADGKGNIATTALLTLNDVLFVVLGGGAVAAISGKGSLPIGFLLTGIGHFTKWKPLQLIGAGTMAANSFSKIGVLSGNDLEGLDGIKERLKAYQDAMKEKFFLDKIMKKKTAAPTNGIGEVQYFSYPDSGSGVNGDLASLDAIEQQLAESALQFQGVGSLAELGAGEDYQAGDLPDMQTGNTPTYDFGDISDRIY